jgi:hypothetical protein
MGDTGPSMLFSSAMPSSATFKCDVPATGFTSAYLQHTSAQKHVIPRGCVRRDEASTLVRQLVFGLRVLLLLMYCMRQGQQNHSALLLLELLDMRMQLPLNSMPTKDKDSLPDHMINCLS